jgi:hypothetical protein
MQKDSARNDLKERFVPLSKEKRRSSSKHNSRFIKLMRMIRMRIDGR